MNLSGVSTIAGRQVRGDNGTTQSVNPATGELLEPIISFVGIEEIDLAALEAQAAFDPYRATTPEVRAIFLGKIADNMEAIRADIVNRAHQESGLTTARLEGELTRTVNQLRLFAEELRLGAHQEVRIDHALPDRVPAPAPDIRQRQIPLGPVAIFGASNFPLAFSVAGGDTASALAAGCPVIVKAHNSHAGTAELAGQAISKAVAESGLPAGTFSIIFGPGSSVGQALAAHPAIKAVAFTGSQTAGTALMHTAANRPEPIPVYAEMSSVNPVILLPGAVLQDPEGLAAQFVSSLTLGAGQFCTNPGLVLIPKDDSHISVAIIDALSKLQGQTMLSAGISSAYHDGNERLSASGAELIAAGTPGDTLNAPAPTIFLTNSEHFRSSENLHDEVFGASALLVTYESVEDLKATLESMKGQLTISVQAFDSDLSIVADILPILERKAGRLIFNGWPTGVEVNQAMVHGGPFPATSDPRATSVGSLAIYRFQRPVSYQGFPDAYLPLSIQEANPWHLPRRVDGALN